MKKEEANNGFHFTWVMGLVLVTVILLTVFVAYYFGFVKKSCQDDACFDAALQKCSMAVYPKVHNYNYYVYSIGGKSKGMCQVNIQLAKMAAGSPPDKVALFEGKSMDCLVPMEDISEVKSEKVESMLQYCTGPLKEAMYEQIIEKLYTIVVSNMGEILGDIEVALRKK